MLLPLVAFVTAPVLAQSLGVLGRGEVASATAPFLLMSVVASLGLPDAVTYFVASRSVRMRTIVGGVMGIAAALGLLASAGIALASGWLAGGDTALAGLVRIAAIPLPLYLCLGVVRGIAQGLNRWNLVAREQAIFAVSRLMFIVGLLGAGHLDVLTATIVFVVSPIMGGLAYLPLLGSSLDYPRTIREPASLARLFRYGSMTWLGAISGILIFRLDQTLMTPLSSTEELGLYVVAAAIGEIPGILTTSIQNVTLAKQSEDPQLRTLGETSRLGLLANGLLSLGLAAASPLIIPLLFGREFKSAVATAFILVLAATLNVPGAVVGAGLAARFRPGLRSLALAIACIANLVGLILLVPRFGATGAAWCMVLSSLVHSAVAVGIFHHLFGGRIQTLVVPRHNDWLNVLGFMARLAHRAHLPVPMPPEPVIPRRAIDPDAHL
ncbi:O-antigen/teichoic acid export membrane protein [Luteococcus japonicus]|uniref:O-antigen/teichoic acid export membrane protein n=2 Tax=Luteococcus japonicus TaxID=33984 RepID=A0A3N1ZYM9_9ACTN|nr:O-antigen/teichoic acid export membrane protein [Luteococcus japonicus]